MATNSTEQNSSSTPPLPMTGSPPKFTQPPPGQISYNMPPPNMMNSPSGATANQYSQYYQQYMQYMYSSMYSHPSYIQAYGMGQANPAQAAAAMQNYYNYNQNQAASVSPSMPPPNLNNKPHITTPKIDAPTTPTTPANSQKPAIKINLKFQQNNDEMDSSTAEIKNNPKKSRFNATSLDSLTNVKQQQEMFNKKQEIDTDNSKQTNEVVANVNTQIATPTKTATASDIVYDINKWPVSLKEYCAKVYQHYQSITLVTEDQVTKYLQQRITNAFKLKPDLNIGWETEPMPDIISIRKVAPYSNVKQLQQQKQNAIAAANKNMMNKPTTAIQQQQQQQQQKKNVFNQNSLKTSNFIYYYLNYIGFEFIHLFYLYYLEENSQSFFLKEDLKSKKANPIKKSDSSSSSSSSTSSSSSSSSSSKSTTSSTSSSSSDEDDNYIKITNNNNFKNNKKSFSVESNLSKFSGKRRVENDMNSNNYNNNKFNKKLKKNGDNNLISRKFIIDNNFTINSQRKNLKSIFELEKVSFTFFLNIYFLIFLITNNLIKHRNIMKI